MPKLDTLTVGTELSHTTPKLSWLDQMRDSKDTFKIAEERPYDYWVGYDENTHKVLWRTDFKSPSTSTLLPFVPDKMSVKQ